MVLNLAGLATGSLVIPTTVWLWAAPKIVNGHQNQFCHASESQMGYLTVPIYHGGPRLREVSRRCGFRISVSLYFISTGREMVGGSGLEPLTSCVSSKYSNQLS